jgi:hypothetical protein
LIQADALTFCSLRKIAVHGPRNPDDEFAAELVIAERRRNRIAVFKLDLDPTTHRILEIL